MGARALREVARQSVCGSAALTGTSRWPRAGARAPSWRTGALRRRALARSRSAAGPNAWSSGRPLSLSSVGPGHIASAPRPRLRGSRMGWAARRACRRRARGSPRASADSVPRAPARCPRGRFVSRMDCAARDNARRRARGARAVMLRTAAQNLGFFIAPPFRAGREPRVDDADDVVVLLDNQAMSERESDEHHAIAIVSIDVVDGERIGEALCGLFERDAVLAQVRSRLCRVPLELHRESVSHLLIASRGCLSRLSPCADTASRRSPPASDRPSRRATAGR